MPRERDRARSKSNERRERARERDRRERKRDRNDVRDRDRRERDRDRNSGRDKDRRERDRDRDKRDRRRRSQSPLDRDDGTGSAGRNTEEKRDKKEKVYIDEFGRELTHEQFVRRREEERARERKRREEERIPEAEKEKRKKEKEEQELENLTEEEKMMRLMGFGGFSTTKGQKVEDNDVGAARGAKASRGTRTYRQYMNRRGGFNRALDVVADSKGIVAKKPRR